MSSRRVDLFVVDSCDTVIAIAKPASGAQKAPVLSLDVPTGFSASSGTTASPHITAAATVTLGLPKAGLVGNAATGRLYLADISVPPVVWADMALEVPRDLFGPGQIVQLV